MFILYAILVGLAAGIVAGGRPLALGDIRLRWWPLIAVGFLAQVALFSVQVSSVIGDAGPPLYVASTLMVGVAVVRNLDLPGMPVIVLGAVSNLAAILANGGYMPATREALEAIGKVESAVYTNSALVEQPALPWLIDRFVLPSWLPFTNVFSIGDVLLGIGVAWLIAATMVRGRVPHRADDPSGIAPSGSPAR
jgi:hypothetical protein